MKRVQIFIGLYRIYRQVNSPITSVRLALKLMRE